MLVKWTSLCCSLRKRWGEIFFVVSVCCCSTGVLNLVCCCCVCFCCCVLTSRRERRHTAAYKRNDGIILLAVRVGVFLLLCFEKSMSWYCNLKEHMDHFVCCTGLCVLVTLCYARGKDGQVLQSRKEYTEVPFSLSEVVAGPHCFQAGSLGKV